MNILNIINTLGPGGAERLLFDSIIRINKVDNIKSDILLLSDEDDIFIDKIKKEDIKIDVIKSKKLYDVRNIYYLKSHILKGDYDIVHVHLFPAQLWVALSKLSIKKDIKYITTEHSTHNRRRKNIFKYLDKFIYNQFDKIISISNSTQYNLMNWLQTNDEKKHVIVENGVDLDRIKKGKPYKKKSIVKNLRDDKRLICMVGRFDEAKDQKTLIYSLKKLPKDVDLILVGRGPLMKDNMNLAKKLGLSKRVHFLGYRTDIPNILKTSDIVVLSSNWEGFGLSAVEAMAAEKPLICSNVKGLKEVAGKYGILFKKNDVNDCAYKIYNTLEKIKDKKEYSKIINYNIKMSEKYSIDRYVNNIINIYKEMLEKEGNRIV